LKNGACRRLREMRRIHLWWWNTQTSWSWKRAAR
jgi:hypothetical protein